MTNSLVLGVNGQDGSYLAETLLARGHSVIGVGRDAESRYLTPSPRYQYVQLDLNDAKAFVSLLDSVRLDYAFHFAVLHGASGFAYEPVWRDMMVVNLLSLHALLEHARASAPSLRIIFAGSCKIFPSPLRGTIDEATPVRATCLYSIGKVAARDLIRHYRRTHGIKATNVVLFHHESPRRQPQYLFPTIVRGIAAARTNPTYRIHVRTLDFWIDWGDALEFMDIVADIAEQSEEEEFILASGRSWYARDAAEQLLTRYGLEAAFLAEENRSSSELRSPFRVKLDKLEKAIGRIPARQIWDTADSIIRAMSERQSAARLQVT